MEPYYLERKMTTVVKMAKQESRSRDPKRFLARLNSIYDGKWVVIFASGEVIARENLPDLYAEAAKKSFKILALFRASKKGQLMYK
jgi:MoaA/NifB/PqqE/SkfB family radical SAM enzyme